MYKGKLMLFLCSEFWPLLLATVAKARVLVILFIIYNNNNRNTYNAYAYYKYTLDYTDVYLCKSKLQILI